MNIIKWYFINFPISNKTSPIYSYLEPVPEMQ